MVSRKKVKKKTILIRRAQMAQYKEKIAIISCQKARPLRKGAD